MCAVFLNDILIVSYTTYKKYLIYRLKKKTIKNNSTMFYIIF